jgi:thioredoxin 1
MLPKVKVDEFDAKVLEAEKPVIVDFSADWCEPCKMLEPILDKIADKYKEDVEFYSADADEVDEIMSRYKLFSLPTVALFRAGQLVGIAVGVNDESAAEIEALLQPN